MLVLRRTLPPPPPERNIEEPDVVYPLHLSVSCIPGNAVLDSEPAASPFVLQKLRLVCEAPLHICKPLQQVEHHEVLENPGRRRSSDPSGVSRAAVGAQSEGLPALAVAIASGCKC